MGKSIGKAPPALFPEHVLEGTEAEDQRAILPISRPIIGPEEKQAILDVLESGHLAQGAKVQEFEERFAEAFGAQYAIATSSGTTSLHTALLAHGVGPGDEIITTPFSFVATANAVLHTGATPVFADIDEDSFNLDPARVEEKITRKTRAILVAHLFGNPCDMKRILALCRKYQLTLIEDACQAHGAAVGGKSVGTFGTGCFSFYPTKNLTTGEGGMILTSDPEIVRRARMIRNHGMEQPYRHQFLGYNFRMTDLQAALGIVQLEKLERWTEQRIANAKHLLDRLEGVTLPRVRPSYRHVFHQFTIRVRRKRDAFVDGLHRMGVKAAVYYPLPIHWQPLYRRIGYQDRLPVAEVASQQVVSLPVHPSLGTEDLDRIVRAVHRALALVSVKVGQQPMGVGHHRRSAIPHGAVSRGRALTKSEAS
jgi:dTDP-4-amino-4,6-dideoxygalactose transaminase